jgi:hypothetical protein
MFHRNIGWLLPDYMVLHPKHRTLRSHSCESLESNMFINFSNYMRFAKKTRGWCSSNGLDLNLGGISLRITTE